MRRMVGFAVALRLWSAFIGRRRWLVVMWRDGRSLPRIAMPEVRFWSWVDVNGPDQCWMWRGATDRAGYGAFRLDGGARKAHRVAMVMVGAAPGSAHALHRCHNPACCNPAHLRPGSDADNAADKVRAGRARGPAGLRNAGAVLRPEKVAAIRLMHAGGASQRAIARAVGVTRDAVRGVVDGRTWRHVG